VCWCSVESASSGWTDVIVLLNLQDQLIVCVSRLTILVRSQGEETSMWQDTKTGV
jgi:hypothetical protein